jgi:hypothetical protein
VYAVYGATAVTLLVIAGDVDVLATHPRLMGLLALIVAGGPLVAMVFSSFASWTNYYGVWRVVRGKDEYDVGQDLKSHAADIPQAVQAMLAGRRGCLPAASVALLFVSLVLTGLSTVPPSTPGIGALGSWQHHRMPGDVVLATPTPTPTGVPTATALPTATATATLTATATATATPTPPPVINFTISPLSVPAAGPWTGCVNGSPPPPQPLVLDNSKSTVAVSWRVSSLSSFPSGAPWASVTDSAGKPVSSGTVPAGKSQTITVNPDPGGSPPGINVCRFSNPPSTAWLVTFVAPSAGTYKFTYNVA